MAIATRSRDTGIREFENGSIVVVGNETKDDEVVPTMWVHRRGSAPEMWEHWPLRKELVAKPDRRRVDDFVAVVGFDAARGLLLCRMQVNPTGEEGVGSFSVQP